MELLVRDWDTWAPLLFLGRERELVGREEVQLVREVREHYWPEGDLGKDTQQDMARLTDIYGMTYFFSPMDSDSKFLASSGFTVFTLLLTQPAAFSLSGQPAPVGEEVWAPLNPALGLYMEVGERLGMARDSKIQDQLTIWGNIKERAARAFK